MHLEGASVVLSVFVCVCVCVCVWHLTFREMRVGGLLTGQERRGPQRHLGHPAWLIP